MQSFSSEISSNKHVKPSDSQKKFSFNITFQMEYLLFLPESYAQSTNQKFPLILFLHGAGERGRDLDSVKRHGIPKIVETNPDFPFIAVSPQCPEDSWWTSELHTINGLIEEAVEKYQVDTSRIYLTGLSMGGFGTWSLASMYPERFAAIAPVCGGGEGARTALQRAFSRHGGAAVRRPPHVVRALGARRRAAHRRGLGAAAGAARRRRRREAEVEQREGRLAPDDGGAPRGNKSSSPRGAPRAAGAGGRVAPGAAGAGVLAAFDSSCCSAM